MTPLKWHGGKHYLAHRIVRLMPPHIHYVEPFAGGLSVLLAKDPEGVSEVVNDIDSELANFWRVLRGPELFAEFLRMCEATPFSEEIFNAPDIARTSIDHAWTFFVKCRFSLAGRMKSFAPLSKRRTRRGMNEQVSAWLTATEGLAEVHERLKRVAVFSRPALNVIRTEDTPGTLFYLDPPYLHETRTAPDVYRHEMSVADHTELLDTIKTCRGKVMLSGYPSDLYTAALCSWNRHDFDVPNNASGDCEKRRMVECLWCNF